MSLVSLLLLQRGLVVQAQQDELEMQIDPGDRQQRVAVKRGRFASTTKISFTSLTMDVFLQTVKSVEYLWSSY